MNRLEMLSALDPFKGHEEYQSAYLKLGILIDNMESEINTIRDSCIGFNDAISDLISSKNEIDDSIIKLNNLSNELY